MKSTPMLFLLLFVRKGYWKESKISFISIVSFVFPPLAYLFSGIGALKYTLGLSETNKAIQQLYSAAKCFSRNLAYNNNFKL